MAYVIELVEQLKITFPEMGGRVIPVSEIRPFNTESVIPKLPLAVAGLIREAGAGGEHGATPELHSDFLVRFIFESKSYRSGGAATPFYAFYDYEPLRDKFMAMLRDFCGTRHGIAAFRSMDIETDERSVAIDFVIRTKHKWKIPKELAPTPVAANITPNIQLLTETTSCSQSGSSESQTESPVCPPLVK